MSEMVILNYILHDKIGKKSSSSWFSTEKVPMFRNVQFCSMILYIYALVPKRKNFVQILQLTEEKFLKFNI